MNSITLTELIQMVETLPDVSECKVGQQIAVPKPHEIIPVNYSDPFAPLLSVEPSYAVFTLKKMHTEAIWDRSWCFEGVVIMDKAHHNRRK